jgi:hypothetical protein
MQVKCTLEVVSTFQRTFDLYPGVELDRQSPIGTPLSLFWRKKEHFDLITHCFLKAIVYPGE